MSDRAILRSLKDVTAQPVDRSTGAFISVLLGPDDGLPHFYTRLFRLDPGGSIPMHRHDTIEHEQFVLDGGMVLTLDGEEQRVRGGQAIYIPAGVAHAYRNEGSEPVHFLCMVPASAEYQTEWLDD